MRVNEKRNRKQNNSSRKTKNKVWKVVFYILAIISVALVLIIVFSSILQNMDAETVDGFCGTSESKDIETISDLCGASDNEIYIEESDRYVPYLVVSDDYNGAALLLRKAILPEAMQFNDGYVYYNSAGPIALYETSSIDKYLNSEFIDSLTDPSLRIEDTDIWVAITEPSSTGTIDTKTHTITRKVFLLSITELGYNDDYAAGHEGEPLPYFKEISSRIAYDEDGRPANWWTRSPDTYHRVVVYAIGYDALLGGGGAYYPNGIRPAFTVDKDTRVKRDSNIIDGKTVFVLAGLGD